MPRPTRDGTLPSRIALYEKEARALRLRTAGYSLDRIAAELGYANKGGAWKAIRRAMQRIPAADVAEYRKLQDARCDELLAALWPDASSGSLYAVDRAIAIERFRAELFGTYAPKRQEVTGEDGGPIRFTLHIPKNDASDEGESDG